MEKTLVLGLGNDLYGDDGIGLHVVRELRRRLDEDEQLSKIFASVDLLECSLTGLSLLDVIIGYDDLIIIDTIKRVAPVTGRITLMTEEDIRSIPGPSPHYVSIPQTIAIGRQLNQKVPDRIQILAVESKNMFVLGEGLTDKMKETLPELVERTIALVQQG